jgi:DNA polymerase-1
MKDYSELNFQNFPKGHEVRNVIRAPDGYLIASFDYASLEARLIAMATQDEEFCADIWANIDTHMRWVDEIADLYPQILDKATKKEVRQFNKSALVFGTFYGSSKKSVCDRFESEYGVPRHIMSKIYDKFWETYQEAKKKQKYLINEYNKTGEVRNLTGRKRHGVLSINKITNYPIQSSAAYDICLNAGDRLSVLAYKLKKPQYQYILQIHDDLIFYLPENRLEDDITFIAKEMVKPIYKWIIVPLEVECSIGKNWGKMEEIAKFNTADWWDYEDGKWK